MALRIESQFRGTSYGVGPGGVGPGELGPEGSEGVSRGELCGHQLQWWASGVPWPGCALWCHQYSCWGPLLLILSYKTQDHGGHMPDLLEARSSICAPEACGFVGP